MRSPRASSPCTNLKRGKSRRRARDSAQANGKPRPVAKGKALQKEDGPIKRRGNEIEEKEKYSSEVVFAKLSEFKGKKRREKKGRLGGGGNAGKRMHCFALSARMVIF